MDWWIILLICLSIIVFLIVLFFSLVGFYFINFALNSKNKSFPIGESKILMNKDFINTCPSKKVSIKSFDNLNLNGHLFIHDNSNKFIIMVHGYRGHYYEHSYLAEKLYKENYNVLLISNRGHDDSEGKYITMEYKEKYDLLEWIKYIISKYNNPSIALYGWSMGGSTIMMCSGLLSNIENVKCIIEDAGYSSIYDQFINIFKNDMPHFPKYTIMFFTEILSRVFLRISFKKDSSIEMLKKNKKPSLFIHGANDKFVLVDMVHKCYNASNSKEKVIRVFDESGHVMSLTDNSIEYTKMVFKFLKEKMK